MTNNGRNLDPTPPGNLSDNVLGLLDSPVGEKPSRGLRENPVRAVQQHERHREDQLVGSNGELRKIRQLEGGELDVEPAYLANLGQGRQSRRSSNPRSQSCSEDRRQGQS